nr:low temperature requirement protein A [uncultured Actinoplanes sp.]
MPDRTPNIRVSTLELFFDLVFVFIFIQLSEALSRRLDWAMAANTVLILSVVWWMYSGYAWLTNAVAPTSTTRRTLLLTGMAGFLVMALAIPEAFGEYGWIFGVSYLVVNLVHSGLFLTAGRTAVAGIAVLAPLNIAAAVLVLLGGLAPQPWRYVCWITATAIQLVGGYVRPFEARAISAGHFAERHALVVIVAIGESIISIGLGFEGVHLGGGAILVAVLALCIAYYLWWCYFSGDDARAGRVLERTSEPHRRASLALAAWGHAHYPMLLGVVVAAVGIKKTVGHAFEDMEWGPAIALSGGVALYLLGHAGFLRLLRLRGGYHRVVAAVLVLAVIPLGHMLPAIVQLAAVVVIMVAAAITEDLPEVRRTGSTAIGDFGRSAAHD